MNENYNFSKLKQYYFFMSISIFTAASLLITDMLLLHMDFDLSRFGVIKGNIYFIPALAYISAAKWIGRLDCDIQICILCYFLRVLLPIILPVSALLCSDKDVLLWIAAAVMALSYTSAMFANNTLLKVMRRSLPAGELNRCATFLNVLLGMPGAVFSVLIVFLLSRLGTTTQKFLIWYAVFLGISLLFQIPAVCALLKVRFIEKTGNENKKGSFRRLFTGEFVFLQIFIAVKGCWMGLVITYFVVYLLKTVHINPNALVWIEMGLACLATSGASFFGKKADRFGYPPVYLCCCLLLICISGLWSMAASSIVLLILYILLIYNGNNGFLTSMLAVSGTIAPVKLAHPEDSELAMGVTQMVSAASTFFSCIAAGKLYAFFNGDLERYFRWCTLGPVLMFLIALIWWCRDKRQA